MKLKLYILIFSSFIFSQAEYQILNIAKNIIELSTTNKYHNIDSNTNNYSFTFIKYPTDITLYNTKYKNIDLTILDYGQFVNSENDVINDTFYANEIFINYNYNKKLKHLGTIQFFIGGLYSQIDTYNSYGISNSLYIANQINNFKFSFGAENIGKILKSYTNYNLKLPTQFRLHSSYNFKQNISDFGLVLNYDITYIKRTEDINHIICLIFHVPQNNMNFYLSNSLYSQDLAIQNDNSKLLAGLALGASINFKKIKCDIGIKDVGAAGTIYGFTLRF